MSEGMDPFKKMSNETQKIGVNTEGKSAWSQEEVEEIKEVRAAARAEGRDEDQAVREYNENKLNAKEVKDDGLVN